MTHGQCVLRIFDFSVVSRKCWDEHLMQSRNPMLVLPVGALKYILLQRTELQSLPASLLISFFSKLKLPFSEVVLSIEEGIRGLTIGENYIASIEEEYESIKTYLPQGFKKIVDIGCGVAAIDALLFRHGQDPEMEFYLIDKTGIGNSIFYGFKDDAAFYNSMTVSKEMLCVNGVTADNIHLIDVAVAPVKIIKDIDVIISLISWGFHYPIETYLDFSLACLKRGACLILDIRKGTHGIDVLRSRFSSVEIIQEKEKLYRVLARK